MESEPELLNSEFYSADPASYFRARHRLLLLTVVKDDALDALIDEGIQFGDMTLKGDGTPATDEAARNRQAFVNTESQVLLHHSGEALIRLFLAHEMVPKVPWVEAAALRSFTAFRKAASEIASPTWPAERRQSVAHVFLGGEPEGKDPGLVDAWDSICDVLRYVARRINDDNYLYNAAKHGMAIQSGNVSISVSFDGEYTIAPLSHAGPSITYMTSKSANGESTFSTETTWIDLYRDLFLIETILVLIDNLWSVARARYLGEAIPEMVTVSRAAFDRILHGTPTQSAGFTRMSRERATRTKLPN